MKTAISVTRKIIDTMKFLYFIQFLSAVFATVLSTAGADEIDVTTDAALLKPCDIDDLDCIIETTEMFLNNTYMGIPEFDIRTIDPLSIPALDVKNDGVVYESKNIIVKGMRNQKLTHYKMDVRAKSVEMTTAVELTVEGDIVVVFGTGKRVPGHASYRGRVLGTVSYNYELKKDDNDIEYFEAGPETIACEVDSPPTVDAQYTAEVQRALSDLSGSLAEGTLLCAAASATYVHAVHNIRAAARVLSASAFFNNYHDEL